MILKIYLVCLFIFTITFTMDIQSLNKQIHQCKQQYIVTQKQISSSLPQGFVYVDQIDPTIISNLRYFTKQNFVGEVLPGYFTNRAIMTRQAALALKNVSAQILKDGYRLVIYDSYRPQKTVNRFVEWSLDDSLVSQKAKYYPTIDKPQLFELGYIAKKSGHTRGSTVDLSIIRIEKQLKQVQYKLRELQDGRLIFLLDDNTQDMGSSFDLLDQASHPYDNTLLPRQYLQKRDYLQKVMTKYGFKGISTQWWHFTLKNQPFPQTYFDFDIK